MGTNRRGFLKFLGIGAATAAVSKFGAGDVEAEASRISLTCHKCSAENHKDRKICKSCGCILDKKVYEKVDRKIDKERPVYVGSSGTYNPVAITGIVPNASGIAMDWFCRRDGDYLEHAKPRGSGSKGKT